jgi:hypothetical protein
MAAKVLVYSEGDTQAYWGALHWLRQRVPIVAVPSHARSPASTTTGKVAICKTDYDYGTDYPRACPAPQLRFDIAPTAASVQLIFSTDYFAWCKQYVAEALKHRPSPSASAQARVLWTLDVWAHVTYALFSLNVNWSSSVPNSYPTGLAWNTNNSPLVGYGERNVVTIPPLGVKNPAPRQFFFNQPMSAPQGLGPGWPGRQFGPAIGNMLPMLLGERASLIARETRTASSGYLESLENAKLHMVPFATLPIFWVGERFKDRSTATGANPMWSLLLETVQPWSSNWSNNWLASESNRDAGDVAAYAKDPALSVAAMQWRLFSARDLTSKGKGSWGPTLSQYIAAVGRQPTARTLTLENSVLVPTHAWSMDVVQAFAVELLKLDYKAVITFMYFQNAAEQAPRLNANGSLMTVDDYNKVLGKPLVGSTPQKWGMAGTELVHQYVTTKDYSTLAKGEELKATAAVQQKINNPFLPCAAGDTGCIASAQGWAAYQETVQKIPVYGQIITAMNALASVIVGIFGGATTVSIPFFTITSPAARTFNATGWSFAANGSSLDIWMRWAQASESYAKLIPGLFTSGAAAPRVSRNTDCATYPGNSGGEQIWCRICANQPLPACAKFVPEFAARVQAEAAPVAVPVQVVDSCRALAVQWAMAHPQYAGCITLDDLPVWDAICQSVGVGKTSFDAGVALWGQYVVNVKGCGIRLPLPTEPGTGTLWEGLRAGYTQGTNPLRKYVASRGFVDRVIVPFNPFRIFGRSA